MEKTKTNMVFYYLEFNPTNPEIFVKSFSDKLQRGIPYIIDVYLIFSPIEILNGRGTPA
jgi:hypothetical protein